jgi:hypothetical protein
LEAVEIARFGVRQQYQVGVTPHFSIIYLLLRSRNFIFGGSVMTSTIATDLLELQARFETWRTNRKYARAPIPHELWTAAADLSRRYPPSLVGRMLKQAQGIVEKISQETYPEDALVEIAKAATVIGDFRLARAVASKQVNKSSELYTLALILETWAKSKDPRLADKIWEN